MPPSVSATVVDDEAERLAALNSFKIVDTPPEKEFDRIVETAGAIFDVPIALVSLVTSDRQVFKARSGLAAASTGRDASFCAHAILGDDVFVVPDAALDILFRDNPLVTGEPFIRFYAGAPLMAPSGHRLGSLCIIDTKPRLNFSAKDRRTLQNLAALAMDRMELRRLEQVAADGVERSANIAAASPDAIVTADHDNRITSWNAAAQRMFGYSASEAIGQSLALIVPPAMRSAHTAGLARVARGEAPRLLGTTVDLAASRKDGSEFPIELSLSRWHENGAPQFGAIIRDVTGRRENETKLKRAAEFDHLTGLTNRITLFARLSETCAKNEPASVVFLDLDGFKEINDTLGHVVGDRVLQVVAERLRNTVEIEHTLARLGGDEFVVFLSGTADPIAASALGEKMIETVSLPIEIDNDLIHVGASVGIAVQAAKAWSAEQLLGNADLALYRAKAEGRGCTHLFTPELRSKALTRGDTSQQLREAWDGRAFELYYQPQVRLSDGRLTGAEALIRWNYPYVGVIMPGAFLPILETSPLAGLVGEWILRTACEQASRWRQAGHSDFRIGVNLFAAQFRGNDLAAIVQRALSDFDLPAEALELEVTENIILSNARSIIAQLTELRGMGVGIAFDDFGTGYASLTMLKEYPVTRLKIDRSFVSNIGDNRKDQAIVSAITKLAADLDLAVIAEGIETSEQATFMLGNACAHGQGYLFGRPMTTAAFEKRFLADMVRQSVA
ncbi:bifunctional diguanylate cyclase/phosphodiesterase [Aureimonas endophytica]|uniref:Bifunctional diguanylate cyclase/phosphodiesterase n=1 Tax=Aureimonas endophytica TaxID=2027858 RepID=A0A917E619_9HYPH|nr:EAL domain-containing protein [Aureimonas endophytica]GGE02967.1 bifunctional diguanylate cyclase/phosphodiesterase [Aureimonas endophytica]